MKKKQKTCYNEHVLSMGNDIKKNPKRFWTHVNKLKASGSVPEVMVYKDTELRGTSAMGVVYGDKLVCICDVIIEQTKKFMNKKKKALVQVKKFFSENYFFEIFFSKNFF